MTSYTGWRHLKRTIKLKFLQSSSCESNDDGSGTTSSSHRQFSREQCTHLPHSIHSNNRCQTTKKRLRIIRRILSYHLETFLTLLFLLSHHIVIFYYGCPFPSNYRNEVVEETTKDRLRVRRDESVAARAIHLVHLSFLPINDCRFRLVSAMR